MPSSARLAHSADPGAIWYRFSLYTPLVVVKRGDWIAAAAIVAACVAPYRKVLRLWWTYDDAFHLHILSTHSMAAVLCSRDFWMSLPNRVFTPLLFLSLRVDGGDATRAYAHQLIALGAVACMAYLVARLWLPMFDAALSGLVVMAGPPFCEIVEQLYHRHYLEGLFLALLSVWLFVRRRHTASAIAYLAAMAAKEVYVPLAIVLLAIPIRVTFRERMRRLISHAVALVAYLAWRVLMIGATTNAYGLTVRPSEWPRVIATLPWRAIKRIGGSDPVAAIVLLTLLACCLAMVFIRRRRLLVVIGVIFICSLMPIIPVGVTMETRFVLVLWVCAAAIASLAPRPLLIATLVVAIAANRAEWSSSYRKTERMANEARFFAGMREDQILRNPAIPPAAIGELAWLTKSRGRWVYDDFAICAGTISGRLFGWYDPLRVVREERHKSCDEIRIMPLAVRFEHEPQALLWTLGPYAEGTYAIVLAGGTQAFDVPRDAGFRVGELPSIALRVRYTSPAGWMTYSPDFNLDFARQSVVAWRRR